MNILKPEFEHKDKRRKLTQVFTAHTKQVNLYYAKRGSILGNHFHKETKEYFLVTRGVLRYNDSVSVLAGEAFVVHPLENHKLECLTDVTLVSFLTKPFDQEKPDLWKKKR